jgi:MSHA pilin protein MshD
VNTLTPFRTGRGLTLVEAVLSSVVMAVMVVAALTAVGAVRLGEYKIAERGRAMHLAQDLMAEILQQSYLEPLDTPLFGREAGEANTSRADYDDVDDYDGWSASPPQRQDGTVMAGLSGWSRRVTVAWADPADLTQAAVSDAGVKRITVTVAHDGVPAASLVALRTVAGPTFEDLR